MTLITDRIADMRRIVDAAGGRDLTKAQLSDFRNAQREVMDFVADTYDTDSLKSLTASIKMAPEGLEGIVEGLETWHRTKGRKSEGRVINEGSGPIDGSGGYSFGGASSAAYGTKALNWGRDFEKARSMAGKALLEVGSTAVESPIMGQPIADPRQARFVFQLMPSSDAPEGAFGYLAQTARTNAAAEVATGALKPTSTYTLERISDTTKVFAHLSEPIDRFLLEDAPNLRQFLDSELRHGLSKAFDAHIVTEVSTAATAGSATLNLAGIRAAITELQETDLEPSGIVLTPADWATIEDEATTTFAENDNTPAATEALARRLYGVPVVVTNSATSGEAIVGAFGESGRVFRTGAASVTIHDSQPRDVSGTLYADYALNQLVLRAEMRAEVAVWRPTGFVLVGGGS